MTALSTFGQNLAGSTVRRGVLAAASSGLAITMAASTASAAPEATSSTLAQVEASSITAQAPSGLTVSPSVVVPANASWQLDDAPAASATAVPEAAPAADRSASAASRSTASTPVSSTGTHTVVSGDTVAKLAAAYGSSVSAIIAANGLNAQALIHVGETLTIPSGSSTSTAAQAAPAVERSAPAASRSTTRPSVSEAPAKQATAPAPASASASGIVSIAYRYIGTPYVWGGSTPAGFDCSGFTSYVYAQAGISIPRSSSAQRSAGTVVSASQAQPGDLVWWPGHVGIYVGGGQYIAAHSPGNPLSVRDIYKSGPTFIRVG